MNKVVGFLCAWASEDWVGPCIKNALRYVDDLWVVVSYHHPDMQDLEDKTAWIVAEAAKEYPQVHISDGWKNDNPNVEPDVFKCSILNHMAKRTSTGDTIVICDVDEFYGIKGIQAIKDFHQSNYDAACVRGRYYCINGQLCVVNPRMERIFKKPSGFRFIPTQQLKPKPKNPAPARITMHHYSMLLHPELKRRYWRHSPIGDKLMQQIKLDWLDRIYMNWDVKNEAFWKDENRRVTGHSGFWINDGMTEKKGGGLIPHEGAHPREVPKAFLQMPDFRELWRK